MTKILVAEDSITQQELIREFLKDMQLQLIFAFNGVEALSLVKSECPAIVILDIVMPRMNGYEVCRQLKGKNFPEKPAVVMYSTKAEKCDFYWAKKQGADAYVSKLDRPQVLIDTIEQLLRQADNLQEANRVRMAQLPTAWYRHEAKIAV
ncbi:MAG: response regulator [Coleofasciculus sp. Co-bin14]|nr:response regulator [Coleofasciculus sp. Co-bin14]